MPEFDQTPHPKLFATLLEELPVALSVARVPGGELVYANPRFAEVTGCDARSGSPSYAFLTRDGYPYPDERQPFARVIRERAAVTLSDLALRRGDGRTLCVRAHARPLFDERGAIVFVSVALWDVTSEIEQAESNRQASRRAAHDLNNLLTVVRMLTPTLLEGEQDPSRRDAVEQIEQAAARALGITRSLLESRPSEDSPAQAAPADDAVPRPVPAESSGRPTRGTVLVVDDERLLRSAAARALHVLGYKVLLAADGAEAVEVFRDQHHVIAAVMLDLAMPRMSGEATYLALREIDPRVPVLLSTGYSLERDEKRFLDLGVRGFIPKPYDIQQISEALSRVTSA